MYLNISNTKSTSLEGCSVKSTKLTPEAPVLSNVKAPLESTVLAQTGSAGTDT